MRDPREDALRKTTHAMQRMLLIASILVFIAGFQVFVLTGHTDRFFAWTIGFPLSAAFLGAGYWAAGALELLASRERHWANARPAVPAVWIFTTLTAIATLLHLDVFRTDSFWAWAWFAVYFIVPVALGAILLFQLREAGDDLPRTEPLQGWLRIILAAKIVIVLPIGIGLFLAPNTFDGLWPWDLTPLLGRAVGAWLIGWSTIQIQILWENDWRRTRNSFLATFTWGALILVALVRYNDAVDWDAHMWAFLLVVMSFCAVGLYGVLVGWSGRTHLARTGRGTMPREVDEEPVHPDR